MSKRKNTNEKVRKKQAKREALKKRKRTMLTVVFSAAGAGLLLTIVLAIVLNLPHYAAFKQNADTYVDGDTGITYRMAPTGSFEPVTYYNRVYGKLNGYPVHEIKGADKKEWLAVEIYDGVCDILCADGVTLPTLDAFGSSRILVCVDGETEVDCLTKVTDAADIAAVVGEITEGKTAEALTSHSGVFTLRFESETYPWLYYCVKYVVGSDGNCCYYDYFSGSYIKASALVNEYIIEVLETEQTASAEATT